MISEKQTDTIKRVTQRFSPKFVGVFGSYARDEQTGLSDLDILVDFDDKVNLLDIIGMEQELSEILGIKVDLVTDDSVNEMLRPYIEKDLTRIY